MDLRCFDASDAFRFDNVSMVSFVDHFNDDGFDCMLLMYVCLIKICGFFGLWWYHKTASFGDTKCGGFYGSRYCDIIHDTCMYMYIKMSEY